MFSTPESYNPLQALGLLALGGMLKWGLEKAWKQARPPKPPSNEELRAQFTAMSRRVDGIEETVSRHGETLLHISGDVAYMRGTLEGISQRLSKYLASSGQGD